jgi:hypothetical protein
LPVPPGLGYEIEVAPIGEHAGTTRSASAEAPGATPTLADLSLAPAQRLLGNVIRDGGGPVAGAHVALYCQSCAPDRDRPLASALTDAAGNVELITPDPGVSTP